MLYRSSLLNLAMKILLTRNQYKMNKEDKDKNVCVKTHRFTPSPGFTLADYIGEKVKDQAQEVLKQKNDESVIKTPTEQEVKDFGSSLVDSKKDDVKTSEVDGSTKPKKNKSKKTYEASEYPISYYNYIPNYKSFFIDGKTYRAERDNKDQPFILIDENGRVLETFPDMPTDSEVKTLHNFITNYQSKFSDEDRLKVLSEIYSKVAPFRSVIKDMLFELEYSPITDNSIFLELRTLLKNQKDTINAIRRIYKKYSPKEKDSKEIPPEDLIFMV